MKVCIDCGKSIEYLHGNRVRCEECQEERVRQRQKMRYEKCKEEGVCVYCKKRPAVPGTNQCSVCAEKRSRKRRESENTDAKLAVLRKFGYRV